MQKKKILIVEDDRDLIETLKIILTNKNYEVIYALNTKDGYEKARNENPDLIILDVMFGEKEETKGFDFALQLKKDAELTRIPILMLTAVNVHFPTFYFSPDTDGEYLPVDDFIDKPVEPAKLLEKVENLLEKKISKWVNWPHSLNGTKEVDR